MRESALKKVKAEKRPKVRKNRAAGAEPRGSRKEGPPGSVFLPTAWLGAALSTTPSSNCFNSNALKVTLELNSAWSPCVSHRQQHSPPEPVGAGRPVDGRQASARLALEPGLGLHLLAAMRMDAADKNNQAQGS